MAKTTAVTFGVAGIDDTTLSDAEALRVLVRNAISIACEQGLEPDLSAPHPRDRRSLMTHLTNAQAQYLMSLMKKQGAKVPIAAAVGRLVDAALPTALARTSASAAAAPDDALDEVLHALKLGPRDEQRALYRNICASLEAGTTSIVAAQASTGIGKTTVAHAVAADWVRGRIGAKAHSVVVVAFPSLHGVKAFASQWQLSREHGVELPAVHVLMGRREFVSRNAVAELLDDPSAVAPHLAASSVDAIRGWLAEQDAGGASSSWWMDGLLDRVTDLDRDSLCINSLSSKADPGVVAYEAQFERARIASVIACSHHMLAFDVLLRQRGLSKSKDFRDERTAARAAYFTDEAAKERAAARESQGYAPTVQEVVAQVAIEHEIELLAEGELLEQRRLPPYQHLIVDEAHLLEQAFASCFSACVSLRETARRLSQLAQLDSRKETRAAAASIARACAQMSQAGADGDSISFEPNLSDEPSWVSALRLISWELSRIKPPKRGKEAALPILAALDRDRRLIEKSLDANTPAVRLIDFSPVKHYPHLVIGQGDVSQPLHMLWAGVQSAVMLSATLYMRRSDGWSARYVSSLQSVPAHRLKEIPVVESLWLTSPVQALHLPAPLTGASDDLPWLMPPSRRYRLEGDTQRAAEDRWLADVATQIKGVYETGSGGVLVPCTSHDMVTRLSALLRHQAGEGAPVVLAGSDFPSLGALRQAAIGLYAGGQRFVMLATGAAWTGFDLSAQSLGQEPSEDNMLTDLVLPRLPFGMNRSITHRRRTENRRDPVNHEVLNVALLVQQALGRLVRRPGLPRNRRIFILDRRLVDASLAAWISPVRRVVDHYQLAELAQ